MAKVHAIYSNVTIQIELVVRLGAAPEALLNTVRFCLRLIAVHFLFQMLENKQKPDVYFVIRLFITVHK